MGEPKRELLAVPPINTLSFAPDAFPADPGVLLGHLKAVIDRHPNLTASGFMRPSHPRFRCEREDLLARLPAFAACLAWLDGAPICRPAKGIFAYEAKHLVERWATREKREYQGHVPVGTFIAAAIAAGYPFDWSEDPRFGVARTWRKEPSHGDLERARLRALVDEARAARRARRGLRARGNGQ